MILSTCSSICEQIPCPIMDIIANIIKLIKIAVPIILIIFGMLDLGKSVIASKPEDIKKNRQMFVKRLLTACLVFLVIAIVDLILGIIAKDDESITKCINTIVKPSHNNVCSK